MLLLDSLKWETQEFLFFANCFQTELECTSTTNLYLLYFAPPAKNSKIEYLALAHPMATSPSFYYFNAPGCKKFKCKILQNTLFPQVIFLLVVIVSREENFGSIVLWQVLSCHRDEKWNGPRSYDTPCVIGSGDENQTGPMSRHLFVVWSRKK